MKTHIFKYFKFALTIIILLNIEIVASDFTKEKMDSLFSLIEKNNKGMGSISIFQNGEEVYSNSIGYTNFSENTKADKSTKYRIGSISKTFTATIILKLIETNKLNFDTKLNEFFPDLKNSEKIKIRHLLKHRSGIFNFTNTEDYASWMVKPISKDSLVKKIRKCGIVFEPDEKTEYSNSNYVLLSLIAEKVTGKEFPQLLKDEIIIPCNLKNTKYGSKIETSKNEALSYYKSSDWEIATETDMSVPLGAGGIISTPTDLNIFLNCLFSSKLVSTESLEMMKDIKDGYGLGMFQVPFYDKKGFGHTGGIDGFQSDAFYFPEEKVSIAYTSNGVDMPVNDILIGVLSIYFNRDYKLPIFKTPLFLKEEELEKYLGNYSNPDFPLKITVTKNGNNLFAQATGQSAFPLEPYEENKFKFDPANIKVEFIPDENKMILLQNNNTTVFLKE